MRPSGRVANEMRPVKFTQGFTKHAAGSVLVEFGDTKVLCTAAVEDSVPWVHAWSWHRLGDSGIWHAAW